MAAVQRRCRSGLTLARLHRELNTGPMLRSPYLRLSNRGTRYGTAPASRSFTSGPSPDRATTVPAPRLDPRHAAVPRCCALRRGCSPAAALLPREAARGAPAARHPLCVLRAARALLLDGTARCLEATGPQVQGAVRKTQRCMISGPSGDKYLWLTLSCRTSGAGLANQRLRCDPEMPESAESQLTVMHECMPSLRSPLPADRACWPHRQHR